MTRYESAKEIYAKLGVDTDAAIAKCKEIPVSLHCWQGDDVTGFDHDGPLTGGIQTTGNYLGKARTPEELLADMDKAMSLMPGKKKINVHACYAIFEDGEFVDRDKLEPKHFQKWVDFASTYWHVDCVRKMSLNAFIDHYQNWCKRKKYNFSQSKAEEIYGKAKELVPVLPKDAITKLIIKQAVDQLNSASTTVESLRTLMNETASKLPEYPVVMAMKGVGTSLGPQLMAEIGDVSRFTHKSAITAFAGVDPGVNESGSYEQKSVPTSKRGSSDLRKTLFQVMDVLIKTHPQDDPVYQFLDKKRTQGKPYYVYMTAGANKFLRIYYGRVKEYLSSLPES